MRRILIACLLGCTALVAGHAPAQTDPQAHSAGAGAHMLPLFIMPGSKMKQVFVHTKSVDTNGAVTSTTTTAEYLNDVDFGLSGYTITKSMTRFEMSSPGASDTPVAAPDGLNLLIARMSGMDKVVFEADESLAPVTIDNWDDIKANAGAAVKTALGKADPSVVNAVFGLFDANTAAGAFLHEDALLSIPHNVGLNLNEPVVQTSEAPSPAGGTLLFDVSLSMTRWDEAGNEAEVVYDSRPQAQSLHDLMMVLGPKLMVAAGVSAPEGDVTAAFDQMKLEKSTHCTYVLAIDTGLVKAGDCTVISGVSVPGQKQVTTETYKLSESVES